MKRKLISALLATAMVASMVVVPVMADEETEAATEVTTEAATEAAAEEDAEPVANPDLADKKVGVCIYQFSDNFMTLFRTELEDYLVKLGFSKDNITIQDGQNDQATQSNQIDAFIADGVDVLIINPVNTSSAETITDKVVDAGIPLVYINREPGEDEEARWAENNWNVTYVGCDARQSGTYQGEEIAELENKGDADGDGVVRYIMVQGDPENVDAQYRTEKSIERLSQDIEVEELTKQRGDWDQAKGQEIVANALTAHGDAVEVVFCNNDAMALGALQAIEAAGRTVNKDIYLVGVDALVEVVENVMNDKMTGTVFNDHFSQSHAAAEAAANYLTGTENEHYIGCDYVKVTADNVADIQEKLK